MAAERVEEDELSWHRVCALRDLKRAKRLCVKVDGRALAVLLAPDGSVYGRWLGWLCGSSSGVYPHD